MGVEPGEVAVGDFMDAGGFDVDGDYGAVVVVTVDECYVVEEVEVLQGGGACSYQCLLG